METVTHKKIKRDLKTTYQSFNAATNGRPDPTTHQLHGVLRKRSLPMETLTHKKIKRDLKTTYQSFNAATNGRPDPTTHQLHGVLRKRSSPMETLTHQQLFPDLKMNYQCLLHTPIDIPNIKIAEPLGSEAV